MTTDWPCAELPPLHKPKYTMSKGVSRKIRKFGGLFPSKL
jgi:hypothetical protein